MRFDVRAEKVMETPWLNRLNAYLAGKITASELAWEFIAFAADVPVSHLVHSVDSDILESITSFAHEIANSSAIPRRFPDSAGYDDESIRCGARNWIEFFSVPPSSPKP